MSLWFRSSLPNVLHKANFGIGTLVVLGIMPGSEAGWWIPVLRERLNANTQVDQTCEAIGHAIHSGQLLLPGLRISKADLAGQFGICRGPLREAISRLEWRRLIERVPFLGVRVVQLDDAAIREALLLHEALEGLACRFAAEIHTARWAKQWHQLVRAHEKAALTFDPKFEELRSKDWELHLIIIIHSAGNQRLETMLIKDVYYQLRLYK